MAEVIPLTMTAPAALRIIRAVAADSSRVIWLPHAKKRMRQRRISPQQAIACLLKGVISEGPSRDLHGYWRCTMQRFAAGEEISVVVSFKSIDGVVVISVY